MTQPAAARMISGSDRDEVGARELDDLHLSGVMALDSRSASRRPSRCSDLDGGADAVQDVVGPDPDPDHENDQDGGRDELARPDLLQRPVLLVLGSGFQKTRWTRVSM